MTSLADLILTSIMMEKKLETGPPPPPSSVGDYDDNQSTYTMEQPPPVREITSIFHYRQQEQLLTRQIFHTV